MAQEDCHVCWKEDGSLNWRGLLVCQACYKDLLDLVEKSIKKLTGLFKSDAKN